jgi:phospholipid/cholesterol/gamma-HCH transport system substrate-binding protein
MRRIAILRVLAVVTAVLLLASIIAVVRVRQTRAANTYTVTAYFSKAIGLFPKSDVRVLGVAVGKVVAVAPQGPRVKVVMQIQKSQKIPTDARAVVIPISLISDRYVQFFPVYESGPALQDRAVLDTDRTSIPVELDDLLASLKKFLDAVEAGTKENPGALGKFIANSSKTLEGTGANADATLGALGSISSAVNAESSRLDSLLVHLNQLFEALVQKRAEITRVNTNLALSLGAVAQQQSALDGALNNLALVTQQVGSIIKQHRPPLETDLRVLSDTTNAVLRHQDSLIRSNDWLHVVADGLEGSHNEGAVHTQPDSGPPHIDVRDAHGSLGCPIPPAQGGVVLCPILGLSGAGSPKPAQPNETAPTDGGRSPAPVPPDILPTPLPKPSILPLPTPLPSPPKLGASSASGTTLPTPALAGAWITKLKKWIGGVAESFYLLVERIK